MERNTIEQQLFEWDGWDDNGIMCPQFYKAVLKVQVGDFPVGTKFPVVFLNGDTSTITFVDDQDVSHTFELNLSVGSLLETKKMESHHHACECGSEHH